MSVEGKLICTLDAGIPCPLRNAEKCCTNPDTKCGFMDTEKTEVADNIAKPYTREKRWYEKYYEGNSTTNKWIRNNWVE